MANIIINQGRTVGTNRLSLGFQVVYGNTVWFPQTPEYHQLARNTNFKLVRVMDWAFGWGHPTPGSHHPCTHWDDTSKTGTFNWTYVDALVRAIFNVGAEPLIVLGFVGSGPTWRLPSDMQLNPVTGLPYPESFAAYCVQWVKHFKQLGLPVRFYEIINEAFFYFGQAWSALDEVKATNFLELFNTCYDAMHTENNNILVSNDASLHRNFLQFWKLYGGKLDTLNFHKYDSDGYTHPTEIALERAEKRFFDPTFETFFLTPSTAREIYARNLPVINSETNFGASWQEGTEPRIQQLSGAVWTALMLRSCILNGVNYSVYFTFAASKSWESTKPSGGFGFGIINSDDKKPWYPYYVNWMIGRNLSVGDTIFEANNTSDDVRVIAWNRNGQLNILLICKVDSTQTINLQGVTGQLQATWIDNTIPYTSPQVQTAVLNAENPITLNGYTVMLLQQAMPISLVKIAAALAVTLIIIGGTYYFVTRRG